MNCFMLEKCLKELGNDSDPDDINVQISCACCGGIVKEANIEQGDGKPEEKEESQPDKERKRHRRDGKEVKENILRSKSSRRSRFCCCLGKSSERVSSKDESLAQKAIDLHSSSSSSKEIS